MQVTKEMIDGKIKVYEEMMEREKEIQRKRQFGISWF